MAGRLAAMKLVLHVQGVTLEFLSENCPKGQCRLLNISRRLSCLNLDFFWRISRESTVGFVIFVHNDQLDTHLLYFTIYFLHSSTCFEHYILIIRRWNCIDTASVNRPLSQWPSGAPVRCSSQPVHRTATDWEDDTRCCINTVQPPDDEHIMLETCRGL